MKPAASSTFASAGAATRAGMTLLGVLLAALGAVGIWLLAKLLIFQADQGPDWFGRHDLVVAGLLGVIALCLFMVGVNLLMAARHGRRHNVVPGPTLYLFGVTMVILGMFQLAAGAMLIAIALTALGAVAMWLEVQFEFI